jgi:hypothetical protein
MDWQTSTSFPSSVPTPQLETSEVSSGAKSLCITQTVYFRSRFNIESSGILTNVLDAVGLGEFSGKQNFFIFKKLVIEQTNNACGHVGYTFFSALMGRREVAMAGVRVIGFLYYESPIYTLILLS